MRVLVACEFSGQVRDAFIRRGHDAVSCDLEPSESDFGPHIVGDALNQLNNGWDMLLAFPPCTHLACSGARYFTAKRADGRQQQGIDFFMALVNAPVTRIAVENPVGIMSNTYRKPDQIIQPFQHGHPESKATCLWLKNLPLLAPTAVCEPTWWKNPDGTDYRDGKGKRYSPTHYLMGRKQLARWENQTPSGQNNLGPSPTPAKVRGITYTGIAKAMSDQWGSL